MADFLYLVDGQQFGPVSSEALENLVSQGRVDRDCLVWREGMAEWQRYSTVAGGAVATAVADAPAGGNRLRVSGASTAGQGASAGQVACSVCQHSYPQEQMVRHGSALVCSICKDQFFANLAARNSGRGASAYAARWRRLVARVIDIALLAGVAIVAIVICATFGRMAESPDLVAISWLLIQFVLLPLGSIAYFTYFTGSTGQTLGKRAMGVRVVTADGAPVSYGRAAGRAIADFIAGLLIVPALVSLLTLLVTPRRQTVHDFAAGTVVVEG